MPLFHYDDGNLLPSVLRTVMQVTASDVVFAAEIRKTKCSQPTHEWPEQTLTTAADHAVTEGAAHSFSAPTAPARVRNVTQILAKQFNVTSTEIASKGAGVENMFLYQKGLKFKEIMTDLELALLHGSQASGTGSLARRMQGATNFITTVATAVGSGTKLTESFFNGQVQNAWTNGGSPKTVITGAALKRVISAYTASATKYVENKTKELVNTVAVYDNDFTRMEILLSRFINSTTNSNATVLIVNTDLWAIAFLESLHEVPNVAQNIHGQNGIVRMECTLEARGQRHNARVSALDTSFN